MLLVPTYVAPSGIHGLGLFAAAPITAGTRVWEFHPLIDREIALAEIEALPSVARDFVLHHSFVDEGGRLILSCDSAIYFNHADEPNMAIIPEADVAARDIVAGEELTEDYRHLGDGGCRLFLSMVR